MKNIEAIQDEQSRRDAVWKVLHEADKIMMLKLCRHCSHRSICSNEITKQAYRTMRDEDCVDGLIKWMYEEQEENNERK